MWLARTQGQHQILLLLLCLVIHNQAVESKWYAEICSVGEIQLITRDEKGDFVFLNVEDSLIPGSDQDTDAIDNEEQQHEGEDGGKSKNTTNTRFLRRSFTKGFTIDDANVAVTRSRTLRSQVDSDQSKSNIFHVRECNCHSARYANSGNSKNKNHHFNRPTLAPSSAFGSAAPPSATPPTATDQNNNNNNNPLPMWLCPADADYCGVPYQSDFYPDGENGEYNGDDFLAGEAVDCYSINVQQVVARNAWPLILLWYSGLMIICCCTIHGHTAKEYILTWFDPNHNEAFMDRLLYNNNNSNGNNGRGNGNDGNSGSSNNDDSEDPSEQPQEQPQQDPSPASQSEQPQLQGQQRTAWLSWQRMTFEQNLIHQVQWIWRHQEFMRQRQLRGDSGSPNTLSVAYEIKTKRYVKNRVNTTTTTSDSFSSSSDSATGDVDKDPQKQQDESMERHKDDNDNKLNQAEEEQQESNDTIHTAVEPDITKEAGRQNDEDNTITSANHDHNDFYYDDDDDDEPTCTICFVPLEEGDRIGALTCRHEFHIDCLKSWLSKRNACPLCAVPVARPRGGPSRSRRNRDGEEEADSRLSIHDIQRNNDNDESSSTSSGGDDGTSDGSSTELGNNNW